MQNSLKFHPSRREACLGLGAALAAAACAAPESLLANGPEPAPKGWSMGDPLPFPVQEIYPCLHDGAIHLAGGFIAEAGRITGPTAAHHVWRPDGRCWQPAPALPAARHHPHLISFAGRLFVIGGFESPSAEAIWQAQSTGWILDEASGNWQAAPELPARSAEAVLLVGGTGLMHFMGGRSPAGESNASWQDQTDQTHHFVLDATDGRWREAAPCPTARNSASGAVIDGRLHIVGGRSVAGGNTAVHEVYDPAEDRWRDAAPMPQAQGGLAAAELGGKLYAFGGEFFNDGGGVYPEAWVYDPATDSWAAIAPMPHPRHGLGAVTLDGAIHVIGGALKVGGNETSEIVEIYRG
ncbi:Kelch repeat-containing protein [Hyphomonas sp.]|uniref:Kelch repeat-containing protein n=1 Tax=Hyphomonas sp. TaxID=87 RepID=UPI00391BE569